MDNHFKRPEGRADQLKAPEHFPMSVNRYTLREMTVVWHMYGGHDFEKPEGTDSKKGETEITT